jgi:hypothetical protein
MHKKFHHLHVNKLIRSTQRLKPLNICYLATRNILLVSDQIKNLVPTWKIFYFNHNPQNALSFNVHILNFKQITLPFEGYLQLLHHSTFRYCPFSTNCDKMWQEVMHLCFHQHICCKTSQKLPSMPTCANPNEHVYQLLLNNWIWKNMSKF